MSTISVSSGRPAKPFVISFGTRSKPPTTKATSKKRTYAALTEDDSGEDQDALSGKAQLVHAFDQAAGGAVEVNKKEEKGPLVIVAEKNLDWREEARRRRAGGKILPAEERARRAGEGVSAGKNTEGQVPVYGLLVTDKSRVDEDAQMVEAPHLKEEKPKSADDEALEALLGEKQSTLVIEQAEQEDTRFQTRTNDTHAFRADIAARPESASLADYEAVPIEDFGLALLRGQGYKPGDPIGRRKTAAPVVARIPQKRANLLGIGAKEVPEGLEEMGAWGKGTKKKGNRIDRSYNPLVLRNRETGEVLTEAELKTKREQESMVVEEPSSGKKSRRHRDYDDDKYQSSRYSSSRRDRSRSKSRKGHRSRRDGGYSDERDSEKRKEAKSHRGGGDDDRHDRRHKYEEKKSRNKDDTRYESRRDDYNDQKHKEKRR